MLYLLASTIFFALRADEFGQHFFAGAAHIDIGRVNEVAPGLTEVIVDLAADRRRCASALLLTKGHRAETEFGHTKAAST